MFWLILLSVFGLIMFLLHRAWRVWQTRFASRHEFDPEHLAMLMAQREEFEKGLVPPPPVPQKPMPHARKHAPAAAAERAPTAAHKTTPAKDVPPGRRKPLLDAAAQEVFLHLRTDLPSYPILAGVDIATLIDTHGAPPPRVQADFVLCKKDFSPAVVIFIERERNTPQLDRAETLLRQHRLRVLRWRADALPAREDMRRQIFKPKGA